MHEFSQPINCTVNSVIVCEVYAQCNVYNVLGVMQVQLVATPVHYCEDSDGAHLSGDSMVRCVPSR